MDDALRALKKSGINVSLVSQKTRELIFDLQNYRILSCKPIDVPKYVEMGTADCGIVGSDCITESMCDVYEPISLKFGKCRMVVACQKNMKIKYKQGEEIKVATKFPNIAKRYFEDKKMIPKIIYLNGSVELAPLVGLSDVIVDITESGETIRKNNLKIIDTVMDITAKVIFNKTSVRTKQKTLENFAKIIKK